jgi:hypothetical protein
VKRYNSVYDGVYTKPNEMVEEPNGDWVRWEDVEQVLQLLSDSIEVTGKVGGIERQGGEIIIRRPDGYRQWITEARAAIAKAKGEEL